MDNQRVFEPLAIKFVIIRVICGEINKSCSMSSRQKTNYAKMAHISTFFCNFAS